MERRRFILGWGFEVFHGDRGFFQRNFFYGEISSGADEVMLLQHKGFSLDFFFNGNIGMVINRKKMSLDEYIDR